MLITGLIMMTLLAGVHPFKMSLKPPANEPHPSEQSFFPAQPILLSPQVQPQLYPQPQPQPAYLEQQKVEQVADTKGGSPLRENPRPLVAPLQPQYYERQPAPTYQFLQPQALAYLIVRPIAQQYQYLEPSRYRPAYAPAPYPAQPQASAGTKGGESFREEQVTQQQQQQQEQDLQQQQQAIEAQHQPVFAKGSGKFLKLKSSLEQLAASAKAKLTLGSTYQVVSEETIQPSTPQPIEQTREEPIVQQHVQQIKEEPLIQQQREEPITQERQPEPILVQHQQQEALPQEQQLKEAPQQAAEEQREQTIEEARKEVKLAANKGDAPVREQTRLTSQSNFEPLRSATKAEQLDRQKGRY